MSAASNTKFYTLGFLVADTSNNQIAAWGGYDSYPVASASTVNASYDFGYNLISGINAVRAVGGDVMASFGGAAGTPIDATITSTTALAAEYESIISTYKLNVLDFDIEGSWVSDAASIARRSAALAMVEAVDPNVKVQLTLPVLPSGLTSSGLNVVNSALNAGVKISSVNILAMDYGSSYTGDMGAYAVAAANATHTQLMNAFTAAGDNYTNAQLWNMQGVTPMIGINDTTTEDFTPADAQTLLTFAQQKGIGYLSFWEATRDHPGSAPSSKNPVNEINSSTNQTDYQYADLYSTYTGYVAQNSQWNVDASGSWGNSANWTAAGIPDGIGAVATLTGLPAAAVVTVDAGRTVGQLVLNNSASVTVSGAALAINSSASTPAGISVLAGSHTISAPLVLSNGAAVSIANGSSLTVSGIISGAGALTLNGGGLTLTGAESYTGATDVTSGTLTLSAAGRLPISSNISVITGGSIVEARLAGSPISVVPLGSVSTDSTGRFDLTGNDLVLTSTTLAAANSEVAEGFAGNWSSGGLVSSWAAADTTHLTSIGVIQNNQGGSALYSSTALFDGYAPQAGDVLVKDTYFGDANLDGKVDASDYSRIDNAFVSNGALTGWFNGDFNYDGVVNGSDYTLIDNAFNTQGQALSSSEIFANSTAEIASPSSVPEPMAGSLLGVAIVGLMGRRRVTNQQA